MTDVFAPKTAILFAFGDFGLERFLPSFFIFISDVLRRHVSPEVDEPGLFFPNEYETVLEIRKLIAVHPHEVRNSVHSASIGKEGSGRLFGKSRPSLKLINIW